MCCVGHTLRRVELSGEETAERVETLARFIVAARQPTRGEEDRPEVHRGRCDTARATRRQLPQRVNHFSVKSPHLCVQNVEAFRIVSRRVHTDWWGKQSKATRKPKGGDEEVRRMRLQRLVQ